MLGEEGKESHLEWWHLSSEVIVNAWWCPAFMEMAEHLMGSSEWIPSFSLYTWLLLYQFKWLYLKSWVFSLVPFWFSPTSHRGESVQKAEWCLLSSGHKPWQCATVFLCIMHGQHLKRFVPFYYIGVCYSIFPDICQSYQIFIKHLENILSI